jgi:hypothetical protein
MVAAEAGDDDGRQVSARRIGRRFQAGHVVEVK